MNHTLDSRLSLQRRLILAVAVCFSVLLAVACGKQRTPCRYLIPDGYVGWVLIEFDVEGARPLREEDGHLVFEIPPSGRLAIPGEVEYGWARDEYLYADDKGRVVRELPITAPGGGGLIWGGGIGSHLEEGGPEIEVQSFFVGPETDYQRAPAVVDLFEALVSERPLQ